MSLNDLVEDVYKPWLNVRMKELCVQGALHYISEPQVNGEFVGIIDDTTGQVALLSPPNPEPYHFSAGCYPFNAEILSGDSQIIDYYFFYSPNTTNFDFTYPNNYVSVTNAGTYLIHYKNNLNASDPGVEMHLTVNNVDADIVYFTGDPGICSMFGHCVVELNAGDQIRQVIVNNSISTTFVQVYGWFTIAKIF